LDEGTSNYHPDPMHIVIPDDYPPTYVSPEQEDLERLAQHGRVTLTPRARPIGRSCSTASAILYPSPFPAADGGNAITVSDHQRCDRPRLNDRLARGA
jgi:hypothetical protein